MAYDSARGRVVLFGGFLGPGNDTWEYYTRSPASYVPFGQACSGTAGLPILASQSVPWIGETFTAELSSLPPSVLNTPYGLLGISRSMNGPFRLPFNLGRIGMTGCSLWVSTEDCVGLTNRNGVATWDLPVPNSVALISAIFYQQGFVLDPGANPFGAIMSNAAEATIGSR